MAKTKLQKRPYYAVRGRDGWTFQCPHEGNSDVIIIYLGKGELVLCKKCLSSIQESVVDTLFTR